ncbi:MAG: BMA_0021/BMA_0022 family TOMM bacteriocin [Polyangia bacterium]
MSGNDLIEFRTAYLRLIARSWIYPAYAKWVVGLSPSELIEHLRQDYNFDWPWPALEISLKDDGAKWQPQQTSGWYGKGFSGQLIVKLPLVKSCIQGSDAEKLRPLALADFYAVRHSIFGRPQDPTHPPTTEAGLPIKLGVSEDRFLEFSAVMVRALALAWDDEEFKDHLLNPSSCLPALAGWLGYTSPWNMNIVVQNDYDAVWVVPQKFKQIPTGECGTVTEGQESADRWNGWQPKNSQPDSKHTDSTKQSGTTLSKNRLVLHLPQCPYEQQGKDEKTGDILGIIPIALAAYNQTGPAYPFTCCP